MCVGSSLSFAQSKAPFLAAIHHYEESLGVKFSYDPAIISLISRQVDIPEDINQFIAQVVEGLPLNIDKISEDYYTILVVEKTYTLRLIDSLTRATIPLPLFFLINGHPSSLQAENNQATFKYKPMLNDTLIAYAPGYVKRKIPVSQLINERALAIGLLTQTYLLEDVLIEDYITKGINMDPSDHSITIEVKDLPLLPGETDGDIFASLAALPGISTPDGRPGNLFIRGNTIDQSLILFDNIPMYHRGHYFGTISPYNQKVVDNVEVHRSGYHPRMGGRVGGAVFINSEEEVNNQSRYGVGMNTLYAMVYGKTPLANKKVGLIIGARHSYPTSVRSPKLNAITKSVFAATGLIDENGNITSDVDVVFQDYHAKLIFRPNEKHKISTSGIYSRSDLSYTLVKGVAQNQDEHIDFENYGANAEWQYKLNNRWNTSLIQTLGNFTYSTLSTTPSGNFFAINKIKDYNTRLEIDKVAQTNHTLQIGVDYKWQQADLGYKNFFTTSLIHLNKSISAHTLSPFANVEWYSARANLQIGLRGNYYSPTQAFYFSPRLSANYMATPWLSLKASAGRYHQFMSQVKNLELGSGGFDTELWMLADSNDVQSISGSQFMTGFMANNNNWLVDVEAYYKTANNVTYYEDRRFNLVSDYFTANDLLYGVDTYLKKAFHKHTSVWVGYSFSDSKITLDTTSQTTYKSKYIQPHQVYVGTAYHKDRWKLSAIWKYGSGLNAKSLEIAYAQVIYEQAQANLPPGVPVQPDPFVDVPERYPNVHSLDVSASYRIPHTPERKWSASFGLSIINVFDQKTW
ncbi:TonB-dependent receptor [Reichenbachiella carrageenanivorans]|uniref:TonB-dependent receptor n=1 Tax=Reichenbachiella carrageenanivorans TaxID=2979869 RepID=A0ABY6D0U0_9BACT|nr:TonB-dependent receptor [Reichenbachiella carrageenanivorans]UXX79539.1 TonB-dependent receptor [Reichenbachiella carrageenanivorans]